MTEMTTIKVPRALWDRIKAAADTRHVTLSAVIEQALDVSDDRAFSLAISAEHAALSPQQRASYVNDPTVNDNLDDTDDDAVTARNGW